MRTIGPARHRAEDAAEVRERCLGDVIADLHCHYAMHLLERDEHPRLRHLLVRAPLGDRARALVMWLANRLANYRTFSSGPRVTLDLLEQGGVTLALSVLYVPFDEMDLTERYRAPPRTRYAADLFEQLGRVERDLAAHDPHRARHTVVRTAADLAGARGVAIVHCVEGGFHLGATPAEIDANVAELARKGVLYITLAHLFDRRVAPDAPAIPFLSDGAYDRLFPQPGHGLPPLGDAAVRAMAREKVVVDFSHMRADAVDATLDLLDEIAPDLPVIASHAGVRFRESRQSYQLEESTVRRIAARGGVVGLIMAQHQLDDGVRPPPAKTLDGTVDVICRHIDRIAEIAGPGHVALGTDLDGFIKPTMAGIESAADLRELRPRLLARYPAADVDAFLHGNARRVVERVLAVR